MHLKSFIIVITAHTPCLIFFSAPSYAGNFISLPRVRMYSTIIIGIYIYITPSVFSYYPALHNVRDCSRMNKVAKSRVLLIVKPLLLNFFQAFLDNPRNDCSLFEKPFTRVLIYVFPFRQFFQFSNPFLRFDKFLTTRDSMYSDLFTATN